ncbi:MAG: hypothetical protein ACKD6N_05740 [Candidatus Bathyarchaeota archaeon]
MAWLPPKLLINPYKFYRLIGKIILRVAVSNMTVYEGIEAMNEWLNQLSSLSDKPLILLLIYSLILVLMSVVIIKIGK